MLPNQEVTVPTANLPPPPAPLLQSPYSQDLCKMVPGATLTYNGMNGTIEQRDKTFGASMGIPSPCREGVRF